MLGYTLIHEFRNTLSLISLTKCFLSCRHGDMLYLDAPGVDVEEEMESSGPQPSTSSGIRDAVAPPISAIPRKPSIVVVEDEVDRLLDKDDGLVHRSRNEQL